LTLLNGGFDEHLAFFQITVRINDKKEGGGLTMGDTQVLSWEKQRLRSWGKKRRSDLSPGQREAYSAAISAALLAYPAFQKANRVLTYASFGAEASLDKLNSQCPDKKYYYPLCLPDCQMAALRPTDEEGWTTGDFGIRVPVPEQAERAEPEILDLVLVPLVAFDAQCRRLGMGKGYYDRYLPRCTGAVKLGVAFSCQQAEKVPVGEWDFPLDAVVTEKGVLIP
jgi:5-formyltetrahydrofolate cyclo-ligase